MNRDRQAVPCLYPAGWLRTAIGVLWVLCAGLVTAQISPGKLSEPHSKLEGSDRCLDCHSKKKRIAAESCLECHELLRVRLESNQGFHATVVDQGCERCHMEHHGEDFELIYWGEGGQSSFDHGLTGYTLLGAHIRLECRTCHKAGLIRDPRPLRDLGKGLDRTFLGLDGAECLNCHQDEHRGQFPDRSCDDCHGLERWKPIGPFDHDKTRYALVGEHRKVACDRCHSRGSVGESDSSAAGPIRYAGLRYSSCVNCHQDPHQGRLGGQCRQCHSESGWKNMDPRSFDHSRTRYPLLGSHRRVRCEGCHPSGLSQPVRRFQLCSDCHSDRHLGQFAQRSKGSECDSCHDLEGFRPARFTLSAHQESRYPLQGAHLAVPCNGCHAPLSGSEIQQLVRTTGVRSPSRARVVVHRYDFPSTQCTACHKSPHEESLTRFMELQGCLSCHDLAGWRQIEFDHERTDYILFGGHLKPTCLDCHLIGDPRSDEQNLVFKDLPETCESCHKDPHQEQFSEVDSPKACTHCHSSESWRRLLFDHNRDSSFALEGVHARVTCSGCHWPQEQGDGVFVRYRPLDQECADCHTGPMSPGSDSRSR